MQTKLLRHGCTIAILINVMLNGILTGHPNRVLSAQPGVDYGGNSDSGQNDFQPQRFNQLSNQPFNQLLSQRYASGQSSPDRGQVPGRYRGTGRRDNCPAVSVPLTAIVPSWRNESQIGSQTYVGGLTSSERPSFWFYVPYALTGLKAEFVLRDSTGNSMYQLSAADFSTTRISPGVIRLSLPANVPSLEVGQVYQWSFRLYCDSEVPTIVTGGIERLPLNTALMQQIAAASPLDQARLYAANHRWYDAITVLGDYWRSRPNEAVAINAWKQLLQSLGIEDVAAAVVSEP